MTARPSPEQLLAAARVLLRRPDAAMAGRWPRAAAFLARQALEVALDDYWDNRQPGVSQCHANGPKFLCLPTYLDRDVAQLAFHSWAALSQACHVRNYELDPTASELESLMDAVETALQRTESVSHPDATLSTT